MAKSVVAQGITLLLVNLWNQSIAPEGSRRYTTSKLVTTDVTSWVVPNSYYSFYEQQVALPQSIYILLVSPLKPR